MTIRSYRKCHLQESLNNLNTNCSRNYLKINEKKTKGIKFRRVDRLAVDEKFYISNREVDFTNTFLFLGVIFSSLLSFCHHLKHLTNKAYQLVPSINRERFERSSFLTSALLISPIDFSSNSATAGTQPGMK